MSHLQSTGESLSVLGKQKPIVGNKREDWELTMDTEKNIKYSTR